MCETGLNWRHSSGTYEGAFGFHYSSWDQFKPPGAPNAAYLASPRQQYRAALNIYRRYGFSGWGCYTHGGYRYWIRRAP
jgi:transglycosylase-like protein